MSLSIISFNFNKILYQFFYLFYIKINYFLNIIYMIDYLCHPIYRYVIFMLIMYSVFKSTPNLNVTNKMLTHLTLLTTVMIYIMDNVTKLAKQ